MNVLLVASREQLKTSACWDDGVRFAMKGTPLLLRQSVFKCGINLLLTAVDMQVQCANKDISYSLLSTSKSMGK